MKAIVQHRYGSADVLQLQEIDRPRPRAEEVTVRVHAAGVDFGVWHLMAGVPYGVGSYAVQLARAMSAEVTGVCSTAKLDFVRALGAAQVIMGRQVWSRIVGIATRQKFRSPLALVNQQDLGVLKEMLEAGTLRPVVNRRYPLSEVPAAVRALAAGHSQKKAVIAIC